MIFGFTMQIKTVGIFILWVMGNLILMATNIHLGYDLCLPV